MRKFTFFIIFLFLALGLAGFWYWQRNPYSKEILKLEILGSNEAVVSEEVEYTVKYKNNGNVRLEEPRLIFEFPEYTLLPEGESRRKEIGPEELGDIYPGEEKTIQVRGRLFGKEGELKTAKAWLSYQPKNLEARYESETSFTTAIRAIPLTFNFDLPSRIEADRDLKFSLNYFSSLDYPLSNLGVRIEYPGGFEFLESAPKGMEKTEWEIPLLNKAEGGRIEIKGRLAGQIGEQKIFKASFGIWQEDEFILLKETTKGVEITRPQIFVFQQINGSEQYVANSGDLLHYEIFFRNIGKEPFTDLFLVARLEGKGFDFESVKTNLGKFNQGDKSIVWDWRDVSELRFLDQGEEGKVEFWINLKGWMPADSGDKNPLLKNFVLISKTEEEFETKMASNLTISQNGSFQDEVFGNSGPVPPKAGETTTYTIIWLAKNYYNDVRNVKVKAVLPPDVKLTGRIFPEEQASKFTFDSQSREIVWAVGNLEAGAGILNSPPNIAFQIALTPESEKGVFPLVREAVVTGEDQWTGTGVQGKSSAINSGL